jgi:N utilization substance protein A
MVIRITDEARRYIAVFEDETAAPAVDCIVDDEYDQVVFVVPPDEMADAIGPGGKHVKALESKVGRDVQLVEERETPEAFVAAALAPAAVANVTISGNDEPIAYAEVPEDDRGVAIGADGRRIETARLLAERHFDLEDVQLA